MTPSSSLAGWIRLLWPVPGFATAGRPSRVGFLPRGPRRRPGPGRQVHIRLGIDRDAAKLHDLRWETLRLPGAAAPLLTGPNLTFSRYLDSLDFRPVNPRSASDIRALVVVADPSDVAQFSLAPVNQVEELDRAHTALEGIPSVELATRGQATLNNIVRSLRDGCDILFLVAHGVLARGEPWLFLEKEDGTADRVSGRELVTRIGELEDRPRLAVLASCQSAGTGQAEPTSLDSGALAGRVAPGRSRRPCGDRDAGQCHHADRRELHSRLLRELRQDGLADRAMAIARAKCVIVPTGGCRSCSPTSRADVLGARQPRRAPGHPAPAVRAGDGLRARRPVPDGQCAWRGHPRPRDAAAPGDLCPPIASASIL